MHWTVYLWVPFILISIEFDVISWCHACILLELATSNTTSGMAQIVGRSDIHVANSSFGRFLHLSVSAGRKGDGKKQRKPKTAEKTEVGSPYTMDFTQSAASHHAVAHRKMVVLWVADNWNSFLSFFESSVHWIRHWRLTFILHAAKLVCAHTLQLYKLIKYSVCICRSWNLLPQHPTLPRLEWIPDWDLHVAKSLGANLRHVLFMICMHYAACLDKSHLALLHFALMLYDCISIISFKSNMYPEEQHFSCIDCKHAHFFGAVLLRNTNPDFLQYMYPNWEEVWKQYSATTNGASCAVLAAVQPPQIVFGNYQLIKHSWYVTGTNLSIQISKQL